MSVWGNQQGGDGVLVLLGEGTLVCVVGLVGAQHCGGRLGCLVESAWGGWLLRSKGSSWGLA